MKVLLELGGDAACIVDAGSDVNHVVSRIGFGAFYYSGQSWYVLVFEISLIAAKQVINLR